MKQPGKAGPRPCERDSTTGAPAAERQAPPSPWPPSARGHVLSFKQTNKEARASKYSPHGRTIPTGVLSHPPGPRSGTPSRCTTLTKHVKGEIAETPFGRIHQLDQSFGGYCRVPQSGTP